MPIDEEFDPRAVRRILRDLERAASALEQSGEGPDTVTYEHDFPDGPLRVTITARGGTASIALYDPIDDRTIVIELEELRRRIKDL